MAESSRPRADAPGSGAGWSTWRLRRRSLANLLRMGHCAPAVMQTLLDASETEAPWLVRLTAGLPGGIGNTGAECGAITAPLALIGLRHAREPSHDGVPVVVERGHEYLTRFIHREGAPMCRDILGGARVPLRCIGVVQRAPKRCLATASAAAREGAMIGEHRVACAQLCGHWQTRGFHCAHAVLRRLDDVLRVTPELLDATSGFIGGTVCSGGTCSALTAGVMALGLTLGEIEQSRPRVLRMIGTMALGGNAFRDDLNAFNSSMNRGHRLAQWFETTFRSTQCRTLTQCDFASVVGVERYVANDGVSQCDAIARGVAEQVRAAVLSARGQHTRASASAG